MPDTRLILHVKGTVGETTELPKQAVQAAISQGKITHSQLIWSPVENTWKQAREWPDLLPSEHLILHVKGTEGETRELPKKAVRAAISQGQISHSQLIWSSADNAWKQVRELPELLPSQKLAPAPARASSGPVPKIGEEIIPESPAGPVARASAATAGIPQVRVAAAETGAPNVRVAAAGAGTAQVRVPTATAGLPKVHAAAATPAARTPGSSSVRTTRDLTVKEEEGSHPFKWICIGLGILIILVLGANYSLVDQPLVANLGQTPYSNTTVYAHFGAFMQPNVIVIHIPGASTITPDNLTDFLIALAQSTPGNPVSRDLFTRVALTSGWTAQYSFSGYSWKQLGDMRHESAAERKEFLMEQLCNAGGQSLMPESTLNADAQQAMRDKVWNDFVAHFTAKH